MLKSIFINENEKNNIKIGNILFLSGTILLPSAFPFGAFLLLVSLIISIFENKKIFLKDRWNYIIYLSILIILLSTFKNGLIQIPNELENYNKILIWINLFNWIPLLFGYIGFQTYLKTSFQRILFTKFLIIGSLPVILSCFLQYVFKIYGPFELFNGLIIWFQRPIDQNLGVSGLFNNANYLSIWLSIVIPFIFYFIKKRVNDYGKIALIITSVIFSVFTILTKSRNGFLALIFTILSFYSIKNIFYFLSTFSLIGILSTYFLSLKNINLNILNLVLSEKILTKFLYFSPRYFIWESALELIKIKPILGWGASTFAFLHYKNFLNGDYFVNAQHTHNIFIELAFNFGIPLSLTVLIFLLFLFKKLFKNYFKIKNKNNSLHIKSWIISCLIILFIHMSDITLYDGKIGLIICILFSGLRCILREQESSKNFFK